MEHQSNGDSKLSVIIFTTLFNIITQNLNRQSMKKIIILLAAVMTTVGINAQSDYNNEISVAYGAGANTDISMSVGRGIFTAKQTKYWGPASLEYFHSIGKNWKIGGIAMVSGCKWEGEGNPKSTYYTVMPAAKYNWLNQRGFGMYSKAGLGVTILSESDDNNKETRAAFNWQVSFVGIEFGGALRGFIELGFGEQGIGLAGIRYKF